MRILHFAAENYAGVPAQLVQAERQQGHESLLVTLYHPGSRLCDEDICLNLPWVGTDWMNRLKPAFVRRPIYQSSQRRMSDGPPVWESGSAFVRLLFNVRDRLWEPRIRRALDAVRFSDCDLLFLDGGVGFLRSGKLVREFKERGGKAALLYCGSDLRTRGMIPVVDALADFRFTVEFDHCLLDPRLTFVFFPFDPPAMTRPPLQDGKTIRIGHAPTNRVIKGTDAILQGLEKLKETHPVEIVLIEGLPHTEALRLKASCHLFVDTLGELGYGINSLEALAMGIPTAVQLMPDFEKVLEDHPFILITEETVAEQLKPYVESELLRKEKGQAGKEWVKRMHDPVRVSQSVLQQINMAVL